VALAKRCLARARDERLREAGAVASAVTAHLAAAEERARKAELDRVKAEGERATAEARAEEEAKTRRVSEEKAAEQRKRRRVQFVLAGSVVLLLTAVALGAGITSLWRTAETARGEAETQRDVANTARGEAETQRDAADKARGEADKARAGEADARREVEHEREKLARVNYGRTIQVAYQLWKDNKIAEARALLAGTRPDLRGWEYDYVHRLCHVDLVTLEGHTSYVRSAKFSPDGSRVVTASDDKTARIWDAATGKSLAELKGHTNYVNSAVFSPDGSKVLTASEDRTARIWDAATGKSLVELKGHTYAVLSAVFSADGSKVLTAGGDPTARIWDTATGKTITELTGHSVQCRRVEGAHRQRGQDGPDLGHRHRKEPRPTHGAHR
jgi:hypothetical protein